MAENCPTCGLNPAELLTVTRTLDICKSALAILAHDPEFKKQGGIILPGAVVLAMRTHNLLVSIAQSPDGTIVIKAVDPVPTIVTPGGVASEN